MSETRGGTQEFNTRSSALVAQPFFLKIGDIVLHAFSDSPGLKIGVRGATKRFLVDKADPDVRIRVSWRDLSEWRCGKKLFDSGGLWQVSYQDGSYHFQFTSQALGTHPYKVASFDRDFTSGEVYLHRHFFDCSQPFYPLEYPLDELLINNLLARGKGVEIHACGVIDSTGKGHLFVGQSGGGKTTIAKLWQEQKGIEILSDDRIVLRKLDGKLWMYGTPWHGEARLASPARAPLWCIYLLGHGQKNELIPIKGVQAIGRLFATSFVPFYHPAGLDFALGFYGEVAKVVPCFDFKFTPNEKAVEFILMKSRK